MDKKIVVFYSIVALVMLSMAVFLFINTEDGSYDTNGLIQMPTPFIAQDLEQAPRYNPVNDLIAGLCALLLVGYLFWFCYRKFETDSRTELSAREDSLYDISLKTGRTEYDLFNRSAKEWSVSDKVIDQDFKRYMSDQVTPYYAKDFVRKNRAHIDESLIRKKEVKPSSWSDWAIALLVFPGSVLFLYLLGAWMDGKLPM
jgi:hypothetical protein